MSDLAAMHALVDEVCGVPDAAAIRSVDILHAHIAALAWVRDTTETYPAPSQVAARLHEAAAALRALGDDRDPRVVLIQVAAAALQSQDRCAA